MSAIWPADVNVKTIQLDECMQVELDPFTGKENNMRGCIKVLTIGKRRSDEEDERTPKGRFQPVFRLHRILSAKAREENE